MSEHLDLALQAFDDEVILLSLGVKVDLRDFNDIPVHVGFYLLGFLGIR